MGKFQNVKDCGGCLLTCSWILYSCKYGAIKTLVCNEIIIFIKTNIFYFKCFSKWCVFTEIGLTIYDHMLYGLYGDQLISNMFCVCQDSSLIIMIRLWLDNCEIAFWFLADQRVFLAPQCPHQLFGLCCLVYGGWNSQNMKLSMSI